MKKSILILLTLCTFIFGGCSVETAKQHDERLSSENFISDSSSLKNNTNSSLVPLETISSETVSSTAESKIETTKNNTTEAETLTSANSTEQVDKDNQIQNDEDSQALYSDDIPSEKPIQDETTAAIQTTPAAVTTAMQQPPQETQKKQVNAVISIRCDKAVENWDKLNAGVQSEDIVPSSGVICSETEITVDEGTTVFGLLQKICNSNGVELSYGGSEKRKTLYVNGINGLYERDCGNSSGWVYSVNGEFLMCSCSGYVVNDGDVVVFSFTDGSIV